MHEREQKKRHQSVERASLNRTRTFSMLQQGQLHSTDSSTSDAHNCLKKKKKKRKKKQEGKKKRKKIHKSTHTIYQRSLGGYRCYGHRSHGSHHFFPSFKSKTALERWNELLGQLAERPDRNVTPVNRQQLTVGNKAD